MISASKAVERLSGSQRNLADKLPKPRTAKVVGLHRGDPSFDTPEYVIQAAIQAMREGYTHYPAPQGDAELREAIAGYQSRLSGVPVSASEVLVTSGGTGAVSAAMMGLLNEGDEVILLDPTYSLYADVARVIGATAVSVPLTPDFAVDVDAVRAAVTPRTKMMVLNFPSNPTGQQLEPQELEGLAAVAAQHDLVVLSDEVYDQLSFKGRHISALGHAALTDRTLLVNSCSKTYAMTGWRVGWVVAKGGLLKPVAAINRTAVGYVNSIAQRAALVAMTNESEDKKWRAWMLAQYEVQRKAMWEQLAQIPGVRVYEPEAAFYAWVRYEAPLSAVEMMKFLYERGLNVRPGTEFGAMGEKHLRFTFAPSVQAITEGIAIFRTAMEELRGS
ncbi:MAG: aminotransferase class I/II-fold pyridoxal phosphate-dependent enzyme [Chloroflexi bacterium]|nr:aminotransferase class I/II-fold pyridoxal phosphate-dependent enzyme [Chloroflexota bacterium]